MGAPGCVCFYGLRFEISSEEVEALELRTDARMVEASRVGLHHYWSNFGVPDENYILFVGASIGLLGPEDDFDTSTSRAALTKTMDLVHEKLGKTSLVGEPELHLQWYND